MAFKLGEPPYNIDGPSVLFKDLGQGILGEANKNGTININSKLDPKFVEEVRGQPSRGPRRPAGMCGCGRCGSAAGGKLGAHGWVHPP